jgi:hypothetical protein
VKAGGLHRHVAIFVTRTRVVDGSGRLVEELIIPVQVGRDIEGRVQDVCDRWHSRVLAVCLETIAARLADLARQYRDGLERARSRESQLAGIVRSDRSALVQPGLFDRRALQDRVEAPDHERQDALTTAFSLLLAQPPETILLIVVH